MANAAGGNDLSPMMVRCLQEARRHSLIRGDGGRWRPFHIGTHGNIVASYTDRTVHALIVRGLLIVIDRKVNSRLPIAVRLAQGHERI